MTRTKARAETMNDRQKEEWKNICQETIENQPTLEKRREVLSKKAKALLN